MTGWLRAVTSMDGTRLNFIIRWAENLQTPNAMLCPQNLPDCTKRHTTCMIYTQVHSSNYLLACGQEFIVCSGNRWISSSSWQRCSSLLSTSVPQPDAEELFAGEELADQATEGPDVDAFVEMEVHRSL